MISTEIKYLIAIKETLNITKAAENLNIAQPSLSRYLKDKENEIGHELFTRENSRITGLSDFGELYFEYADKIAKIENKYLLRKAEFEKNSNVVTLLIPIVISQNLVDFIIDIRKKNPDIEFRIATDSMSEIQKKITEGVFDYAVVHYNQEQKDKKCLYKLNTTLIMPKTIQEKYKNDIYLDDQGRKHIDLKVLNRETFYLPTEKRLIGKIAREVLKDHKMTPSKIVEWDSSDLCVMMAKEEEALCFYTFNKKYEDVHVFLDKEYTNYFYLEKINKDSINFKQ